MKLVLVLLLSSFYICALAAPIQDEKEHEAWMKSTLATVGSMRKDLEAKNNAALAEDAEKIKGIFKKVEGFWQARKTEDAVKWAQQAQTSAGDVATAAKDGDTEKAGAGLKNLMSTCTQCHTAHRERLPEGGYKIK